MKNLKNIREFSKKNNFNIEYDSSLKNLNWFNIGGKTKVFFRPKNLKELITFLKNFGEKEKIFLLGAGSNILIDDQKTFDGVFIKLGKEFSNISILRDNIVVAGSAALDRKLSLFAMENNLTGFEFLSCIPGTVGGGLKMNSGCFSSEFKDIVISIQALSKDGKIITLPKSELNFGYRKNNIDKDLIFLSASFLGKKEDRSVIEKKTDMLIKKKNEVQPTKIKTGGSTFKNPILQTNEKVWELIKKSVPLETKFGDAEISKKHCNFFINTKNSSFSDMNKLIDYVKKEVKKKTGIEIETEIEIVK